MSDIFEGLESDDCESGGAPHAARAPFATAFDAARFMLAGKAIVTLESVKTGTRFTFKISAPKNRDTGAIDLNSDFRFVSVLNGPDNWSNYAYFGYIRRGVFFHGGAKAKASAEAPSVRAFDWTWRALAKILARNETNSPMPESLRIWHAGKCGRCGLQLTVPASIASGFGPECVKHVGL